MMKTTKAPFPHSWAATSPEGGALCVDSVRPRAYTEEDQLLLHRFARHLARQVHSAGLACDAEDLRRYFTRLEQLSELSAQNPHWRDYLGAFLRLMAEHRFEYVAFATAQEGGSTYTVEGENTPLLITEDGMPELPLTSGGLVEAGFPQRSARTCGRGRWFSQYAALRQAAGSAQLQSVMCLPVHLNKVTCGVLCFAGLNPRSLSQNLRTFTKIAVTYLAQYLEMLYLRHRLKSLLPRAKVHRDGAMAYDPDTAPSAPMSGED